MEKCGVGDGQARNHRLWQLGPQDLDGTDGGASGEPS